MQYALTTDPLTFQSLAGNSCTLKLTRLADLNATIDALFAQYAAVPAGQNARWLEDLCPYFGVVWPSAMALAAEWMERFGDTRPTLSVLELGCGLAIPSLLAAQLGAAVLATDFHPDVPEFLRLNLAANQIERVNYLEMDWKTPPLPQLGAASERTQGWDWIIGSDILYEKEHPALVAQSLKVLVQHSEREYGKTPQILLADPGRPYLQSLSLAMQKEGFSEQVTIRKTPHESIPGQNREVFILHYRPSASSLA